MGAAEPIHGGIYLVGGASLSHFQDAASFIIDCGSELVMVDSGAGKGAKAIEKNIREIPCDPARISSLVLTHCHVDHIGSAKYFHDAFGCRIVAHDLDAAAIETGNPLVTAASWYGTRLPETPVDVRLHGDHGALHAEAMSCTGSIPPGTPRAPSRSTSTGRGSASSSVRTSTAPSATISTRI